MRDPDVARDGRVPPVVTASAIGQATFCPYALYLRERGTPVSTAASERLARGTGVHRDWNASQGVDDVRDRTGGWHRVVVIAVVAALVGLLVLLASR